jgi:hypothetical protein
MFRCSLTPSSEPRLTAGSLKHIEILQALVGRRLEDRIFFAQNTQLLKLLMLL